MKDEIMDKTILVTGASGGIGKATVINLLEKGYKVIGVDIINSDIKNENYSFLQCDLSSFDNIELLKNEVNKLTNHLDGIMNLAGIFKLQTMLEGNDDDFKKIIDVNFYAAYKINKELLPILDKGSKIIIFSSEVARYSPQPFNGYYALSKIILDKYADILRRELNYLGIKVIKVQSGAIKTGLLDGVNAQYEETVNKTKYHRKPLIKLKKLMDDEIKKRVDPKIVSNTLVKIYEKKHPKILYKIKNSLKLRILNALPEKIQDYIYINVIK